MSRFWVAGATGFLGTHLVRCLRAAGHDVVAVSKNGGQVDDVTVTSLDVLDAAAVASSASGCDGAFLATGKVTRDANAASELHQLHVVGTRHALRGLKQAGVRRAVLASTSGTIAVGTDSSRVFTEADDAPMECIASWPYYRTKLFAEHEALSAIDEQLEVVIVNPSLLLGPGDLRESSTKDVRLFLERSVPAVPAGGYAFVDVRDAALGMLLAFEKGRSGERYLLNARNLTIAALFQRLSRMTGVALPLMRLPASRPLAMLSQRLFEKTVRAMGGEPPVDAASVEMSQYYWYCDSTKAETELGWRPRDPGETLRDTIDDLVARKVVVLKPKAGFRFRAMGL